MDLSWFQSLFLGFISGITEVLPVSAQAHRLLFLKLFGAAGESPVLRLMVHICAVFAIYLSCRSQIGRMMRAQRLSMIPKKRRKRPLDTEALNDFRLLRTTLIPTILVFLLYPKFSFLGSKSLAVAALMFLNGIILYIPQYLPGSNKSSGAMTPVDGLYLGLGCSAAALPGISGVGTAISVASIRGMDLKKALTLVLIMNIPVNIGFALHDLIALLSGGAGSLSFGDLFAAVLAGAAAFGGVVLGINVLKKITENLGWSVFGFYSWGAALLTFILFLAAV